MHSEVGLTPPAVPEVSDTTGTTAIEPETPPTATAMAAADFLRTAQEGRRMPEHIRRHLIRLRDGQFYLPVAYRVAWFREECPDWGILTDLLEGGCEAGWATVKATVLAGDGRVIATGMKTESKGDFPAGWVEKAETGAIGRALAMAGYGTQFAPDLDDTSPQTATAPDRGRRPAGTPARGSQRRPPAPTWPGPGQCPKCHAPAGKPHGRPCSG